MPPDSMQYRPLGRTGLSVSAVGFGTAQLRRVSPTQAIDTLLRGFDLGVNIVHTAPDYEGAEDLVATAVARTNRRVIVASNAYDVRGNATGHVGHFERLFEATCQKLRTGRLDLFGIASVEDREACGENVWGRRGMVEFLQRMKARGRLQATFCTTHGRPEFARKLIESGAFDAVMLAYNDLGFHSLTLHPPEGWHFEDVHRTGSELFPLCAQRGIGLMVMLPLAGGLLVPSKAFPPDDGVAIAAAPVRAGDALRSILSHAAVSCVLPGTASVEEAEENAAAGSAAVPMPPPAGQAMATTVASLRSSLCSRCGQCEPTCSRGLKISWLFRAGYMSLYPSSPYETWEEVEYFRLHPALRAVCADCDNQTCRCPSGLQIPSELVSIHDRMLVRLHDGRVQPPPDRRLPEVGGALLAARLVTREFPMSQAGSGGLVTCRVQVENRGRLRWRPPRRGFGVRLVVLADGQPPVAVPVRSLVHRGERCHFVFDLASPPDPPPLRVRLRLQYGFRGRPAGWSLGLWSLELWSGEVWLGGVWSGKVGSGGDA